MSVKYAFLKRAARLLNFQKIMAQLYSKLQETFKNAVAVPCRWYPKPNRGMSA